VGDSRNIIPLTKKHYDKVDFIFSCPPYFNLEVYTDKESDISSINNYDEFIESYNLIIFNTVKMLKDRRFAGIVVSNFRDRKTGFYYNFVGDTINAFKKAGMGLYNEVIYQQMAGTASLRAGQVFRATRKFTRTHQSLLLFYKGENPKEGLEQHCFSIRPDGDRLQQFLSKGNGQIDKFLKKSHHNNAGSTGVTELDSNDESESADEAKRVLPRGTDSGDDESEPENDHNTTNLDPILSSLRPCKVIIQPIGYYTINEIEESDNEKTIPTSEIITTTTTTATTTITSTASTASTIKPSPTKETTVSSATTAAIAITIATTKKRAIETTELESDEEAVISTGETISYKLKKSKKPRIVYDDYDSS